MKLAERTIKARLARENGDHGVIGTKPNATALVSTPSSNGNVYNKRAPYQKGKGQNNKSGKKRPSITSAHSSPMAHYSPF